jgi:transcriptional regulator with XRE-family HTH domain
MQRQRFAGARLRQLRENAGVTIEQLARVYGSGSTVWRIEEIENSFRVNAKVLRCYRSAIAAIVLVRGTRKPEAGR